MRYHWQTKRSHQIPIAVCADSDISTTCLALSSQAPMDGRIRWLGTSLVTIDPRCKRPLCRTLFTDFCTHIACCNRDCECNRRHRYQPETAESIWPTLISADSSAPRSSVGRSPRACVHAPSSAYHPVRQDVVSRPRSVRVWQQFYDLEDHAIRDIRAQ